MSRSIPARINPDMLVWARETARLSLSAAAERLHVEAGQLAAWERGDGGLTVAKLGQIATAYRRPLAAFYLSARPPVHERVRDFRRLPDTATSWGPHLAGEMRRAEQQRDDVLELLELRDEQPRGEWKLPAASADPADAARTLLAAKTLAAKRPSMGSQPTEWFYFWSSALEEAGVLVITMNSVPSKEARGFSIAAAEVPVVAVNGSEHFNGRIFTLMHEYAHLLLSSSGLCDLHDRPKSAAERDQIEVECNRIAGEILVPTEQFLERPIVHHAAGGTEAWPQQLLRDEARVWGVSPEVVLRRLVDVGAATRAFYKEWRLRSSEATRMESWSRPRQTRGGDGLRTKVRNLGKGYVRLVVGSHNAGLLSTYETANLLGSKTDAIPKLLARAGVQESD